MISDREGTMKRIEIYDMSVCGTVEPVYAKSGQIVAVAIKSEEDEWYSVIPNTQGLKLYMRLGDRVRAYGNIIGNERNANADKADRQWMMEIESFESVSARAREKDQCDDFGCG